MPERGEPCGRVASVHEATQTCTGSNANRNLGGFALNPQYIMWTENLRSTLTLDGL